jgi:protease-4
VKDRIGIENNTPLGYPQGTMTRFLKKLVNFIGILIVVILIVSGLYTILSHISIKNVQVETGEKVGVVPIKGVISSSKKIIKYLNSFENDSSIKAVVLRIDSPGGMVGPTQEIWEKVMELKNKKRVYASIGSVGASGAYYIASSADYIMADPGSIVGSIGVIMEFPNVKGLMEKAGVKMKNLDDKKRCYRGGYNHPSVIVTHALLTPSCLANSALVQLFSFISSEYLFRRSSLVSLEGLTVDDKMKA